MKEEVKKFSMTSFCGAMIKEHKKASNPWADAGIEKEMCEQYAKIRTNIAGDGTLGGYLIPPEAAAEIIDLAIAATPILGLANTIRGLVGELPIPTLTGRPTAYMVGENGKPTASNNTYGLKTLRPKKAGAFSKQSSRLAYQSRGVSDTMIKKQIANAMSLKMSEMFYKGSGADKEPAGIMIETANMTDAGYTSDILSTNGARFRIDDTQKLMTAIECADEYPDSGNYAFLMHPRVRSGMRRERVIQYSGQAEAQGMPIMGYNPLINNTTLDSLIGAPIKVTTQVTATDTVGSSTTCSKVLFGNWEYFYAGLWRDFTMKISDVAGDGSTGSAFLDDMIYIVAFQEFDCALVRPTAFTFVGGAETSETSW